MLFGFGLYLMVTHEAHLFGIVKGDFEALKSEIGLEFMHAYAGKFNHFGHGVIHGIFGGFMGLAVPLLSVMAIVERK